MQFKSRMESGVKAVEGETKSQPVATPAPKPKPLSARQETFAKVLARGLDPIEAAAEARYSRSSKRVAALAKNP